MGDVVAAPLRPFSATARSEEALKQAADQEHPMNA